MTDRPFPPVFATNRIERGESVADEINRLLRGLREQLAVPPTIAIATAYLNAQGFELLADELERAPRRPPADRRRAAAARGAPLRSTPDGRGASRRRQSRTTRLVCATSATSPGSRVERDAAERRLVAWLRMLDGDGTPQVEVRRYTKGFLHGKAYIPESDLAGVLAGSSNLTFAGLMLNRELNLGYETGSHKRLVRDWFEELWADAEPYDLAAIYEERFLLHDPWIVFLRMLVTMYGYPGDDDSRVRARPAADWLPARRRRPHPADHRQMGRRARRRRGRSRQDVPRRRADRRGDEARPPAGTRHRPGRTQGVDLDSVPRHLGPRPPLASRS